MSRARTPAITAAGLTKRFDATVAVHDVSFTVTAGSVAALVGPPGSGKTTVAGLMLGLVAPTAGTRTVEGRAGAVLDPRGLQPGATVRGQLRVYAGAAGAPDEEVDALLVRTGLRDLAGQRVRSLGPAQQIRLAAAIALLGDPPVLVLDDPFDGLEAPDRSWLADLLRGHTRRGGTALLTSQSLAAAVPIADQLIVLSEGVVVYQGTPRTLRRSHPDRLIVGASSPIALATALAAYGFTDTVMRSDGRLAVAEAGRKDIENAAVAARVQLTELIPEPVHPDRVLAALTRSGPAPVSPVPTSPYGVPR
ncbi:ATP-binding cassette domain-containing protein [Nocardia aurantia]|uniref:Vitamin B12 import ATP-binding protein BtuD n=1 Tax=Nocardia aurantia TaxID=2585199 RepID=A0A7K0DTH2_9NOCA|nr:ATP-binding cassette domain-containing protein [Nocardia aurantia]MQY28642.1 Vitamin B12 import ATP-binding protein BtuD [Nocardia aurantia]